jgi:hypothetical protein
MQFTFSLFADEVGWQAQAEKSKPASPIPCSGTNLINNKGGSITQRLLESIKAKAWVLVACAI